MNACLVTSFRRVMCCCLSLGLLVLLGGCGGRPRSVEHADVSGQVRFQGKPLPGGKATFVAVNGGFASSGKIDENGHYQIKAPVGEVQIGVTNRMLQANRGSIKGPPLLTKTEAKERQPLKGRYVKIPSQYEDPSTSGLTYTVKPGPQTHDIELSNNFIPPPSATGP
jgi:hypothetical protein